MLWFREELEYTIDGEEEKYTAAGINRFRESWYALHLVASFWRVVETTKEIWNFLKTGGAFSWAKTAADITPGMLSDMIVQQQQAGCMQSVQSILADKNVPKQIRTSLRALQQATANVLGTDGHRRLLRHEGVAYTLSFGPPLVFMTPNLADTKQRLLLVVQGEEFSADEDLPCYREMVRALAGDPAGQAFVFELMIRLFFQFVLGVRPEAVGWGRGEFVRHGRRGWFADGAAAACGRASVVGPVLAAFGPIEAQGRGSLHPHILVWLLAIRLQDVLKLLLKDRASFRQRIQRWMLELVRAVLSVQHASILQLPRALLDEQPSLPIAALPFGPTDQRFSRSDGEPEMANLSTDCQNNGEEPKPLFIESRQGSSDWVPATRPHMPIRNRHGEVVSEKEWELKQQEEKTNMWSESIAMTSSGNAPRYRLPPYVNSISSLQQILPSEDYIRQLCHDARDLVIGCAIHFCSKSC